MNSESPALGRASADARDVEDESSGNGGQDVQGRLFDPERYSPVSVAVWQRLPESSARAFAIGTALGRLLDAQGTSDRLRNGKEAACSLIRRERLPVVLAALGDLSPRQWRRYVTEWQLLYVAHKCSRGVVALFTRPLLWACPACKAEIVYDHPEPSSRRNRGPGFASNGPDTTAGADVRRPLSGAGTTATVAQERPFVSTDAPHQESGINGMEVGVSSEVLEVIGTERVRGLSDHGIAGFLNRRDLTPPPGFARWTGYAVRVAMGEASHAA
jgi:hypothetical protein